MDRSCQSPIRHRPAKPHQSAFRFRHRNRPLEEIFDPSSQGLIFVILDQVFGTAEDGDNDEAVGEGDPELGGIDGLHAAVGGEGREAVAGGIGGAEEVLELEGIDEGGVGGDGDGRGFSSLFRGLGAGEEME